MVWANRTKHVPDKVRRECLDRDGHQCTATTRDGGRCRETTQLEAAHYGRWHAGEQTTVDMVRTLCHWHHNRETQQEARAGRSPLKETRPPERHPGLR
jgi:hypothetical protein